jgi:hypothetical protein
MLTAVVGGALLMFVQLWWAGTRADVSGVFVTIGEYCQAVLIMYSTSRVAAHGPARAWAPMQSFVQHSIAYQTPALGMFLFTGGL